MCPLSGSATTIPEVYTETEDPEITAFQRHQNSAEKPTWAEAARTLMAGARYGVLSTLTKNGQPSGSVVEFVADEQGRPILSTSELSGHTRDMRAEPRASITVTANNFKSLQDARFSLNCTIKPLAAADIPAARELYLKKYPDAFYVDFGDFVWWRMEDIVACNYNGGFGMAPKTSVTDYTNAKPDPVTAFSGPVCSHMNDDHMGDTLAIVKHYTGMTVDSITLLDIDRLGMNAVVKRKGDTFKMRLPYPSPAEDRKSIKDAIVLMTRTAKAAIAAATAAAPSPPPAPAAASATETKTA
ncbi:MAG: hypothetical protein WDW38_002618 [Sanguina aurantia]